MKIWFVAVSQKHFGYELQVKFIDEVGVKFGGSAGHLGTSNWTGSPFRFLLIQNELDSETST